MKKIKANKPAIPVVAATLNQYVNADLPEKETTALCEFIDNGLGEGSGNADKIEIAWNPDCILICDNGDGIEHIQDMFTMGESHNRLHKTDIGSFGYGSKIGVIYLGWEVIIDTVHKGVYTHAKMDWKKVAKKGEWPTPIWSEGTVADLPDDCAGIANGGTIITIFQRHDNRKWLAESQATKIAHTYSPGLKKGKEIILTQNMAGGVDRSISLSELIDKQKLKYEVQFEGEIRGKKYSGIAGAKVPNSTARSGLHISYGHRVIKTETSLINRGLPPAFYGEINLSSDWKKSLTVVKSDITHGKAGLLAEIEKKISTLLDDMDNAKEDYRMDMLSSQLAESMAQAFANIEIEGEYGEGDEMKPKPRKAGESKAGESKPKPAPKPKLKQPKREAIPDGKFGKKGGAPPFGLKVAFNKIDGDIVYTISASKTDVAIYLNKSLAYIKDAMKTPVNSSAMWGIIAGAIVEHIFNDVDENIGMLKGLKAARFAGATDADLKQLAYYGILAEVTKLKEPTKGELKEVA